MENLTKDKFLSDIFDYQNNPEWNFKGDLPTIIDFYADWCGPCKMLSPVLEELSEEYNDKINFFKIDTEVEQELAAVFGIKSIPSMLFIPKDEQPQMVSGFMPKERLVEVINDILL